MEAAVRSVAFAIWVFMAVVLFVTCALDDSIDDIEARIYHASTEMRDELKTIGDKIERSQPDYEVMLGIRRDLNRMADELGKLRYKYTGEMVP